MNQEQIERERLIRTEMLLGEAAMERLRRAHVAVFGIGGVGGYAAAVSYTHLLFLKSPTKIR